MTIGKTKSRAKRERIKTVVKVLNSLRISFKRIGGRPKKRPVRITEDKVRYWVLIIRKNYIIG